MLFLKEVSDDLRLSLTSAQVAANAGYHLGTVAGSAFSQAIGLDVLVQQFIGVTVSSGQYPGSRIKRNRASLALTNTLAMTER